MTITFENDNDVIVYALEKIIAYAREYQYFFVENCTWWIASVIGLDEGLQRHLDNLASRQSAIVREISTTPRDIARDVSIEFDTKLPGVSLHNHVKDPLKRTKKGQVNPRPQRNPKKTWKGKRRINPLPSNITGPK